jgi:hypothetical protein
VLGRDELIVIDYNRPVSVEGYDWSLSTNTYQTVSGVVAYDNPQTGEVIHLVINQAIHIPHLDHHLLCPMQCRVNDVTVGDLPKFLAPNPTDETHALTIPDDDDPTQTVTLPLALRGATSLLNVRKTTEDEWLSETIARYHLTSEMQTWDPTTTFYVDQEAAMIDYHGDIIPAGHPAVRGQSLVINELASLTNDTADVTDDDNFHRILQSRAFISSVKTITGSGYVKTRQTKPIDHQTLAARWMISPEKALQTITMTTQ